MSIGSNYKTLGSFVSDQSCQFFSDHCDHSSIKLDHIFGSLSCNRSGFFISGTSENLDESVTSLSNPMELKIVEKDNIFKRVYKAYKELESKDYEG